MKKEPFFFQELEQYKNATALITEQGEPISYQELVEQADCWASQIESHCLVFLLCKNTVESVIGYLGCMRKQIVPVLLSAQIDPGLLQRLLDCYHPSYLWAPAASEVVFGEVVAQKATYVLRKTTFVLDYSIGEELALLLPTSGSTGSPKLVRQTRRNIQKNTESILSYLPICASDRAITTLPMYYTYGLSILNTHLCIGASVILTEATLLQSTFWQLLEKQKATTFGGVPYTYEMLKKLHWERKEEHSIRYLTQAGGKLGKELMEQFIAIGEKKKIPLIVMYGQTEATARMSYLPWERAKEKIGSIGIAIPGGRFSLVDEKGKEVEKPGEIGELIYFGENVTPGYAESRWDLEQSDANQGRLETGDLAKRDEEGFFYLVGRKKRFLKLFGNRVNLDEVEQLLRKEGIESVCSGRDDRLVVFLTNPKQKKQAEEFLVGHTGIQKGGLILKEIAAIPRSETGKIQYAALEIEDGEKGG